MSLDFNLKQKKGDSLLIELETEAVRAILFSVEKTNPGVKKVIIKGESRKQLEIPPGSLNPLLSKINTKISFSSEDEDVFPISVYKETIKQAVLELLPVGIRQKYIKNSLENLLSIVHEIIVVLSPSLVKSRIDDLFYERKNDSLAINEAEEAEIRKWLHCETNKRVEEYSSQIGLLPEEVILIDLNIENIAINGYSVDRLLGYSGKVIELKIISTIAFTDYLNEINLIFENPKRVLKITHSGALLCPFIKERKINGTLIEIRERGTQLFVANNGIITRIIDVNFGNQSFVRAIENRLGILDNEAIRLRNDYVERKLSEKTREKMNEIITEVAGKWLSEINRQVTLANEKNDQKGIVNKLPSGNIFLFGRGAELVELKTVIENNWQEILISMPSITVIDPRIISRWLIDTNEGTMYKDLTGRISNTEDAKVLIGLLYE